MTIRLLRPFNALPVNTIASFDRATENALVEQVAATFDLSIGTQLSPNDVFSYFPENQGFTPLVSGQWNALPAMFRLRLMGSGTVQLDARNRLGVETLNVLSYSALNATDQIEFPYCGDTATMFRASFPLTLAVEMLK
jgi:hypothetical protein